MLLLQLKITYACNSDKGCKIANLYVRVIAELKEIKKTTINERIFMEVGIGMREGKNKIRKKLS